MARALLEILGDASSAKLAAKETAAVYKTLEHDTKQLAVSAQTSARLQVDASLKKTARLRAEVTAFREIGAAAKAGSREQIAAAELAARAQARLGKVGPQAVFSPGGAARIRVLESVKQTEALRAEALAYREVAAVAVRGSREQIAAAQLATRAEQRLATSLGVSSHEARAFSRSSSGVERDVGRATRGALAGSGVFRGLGRSIAFASGGFLAFASAGQFVRTSIDAAKEAQVTQRQLGKQLQNDGASLKDYRGEIDKTGLRISALSGFTKDDLDAALTTILRSTSNVRKALRDEGTAADFARAKHISLAQAALVVGKAEAGNTTLLRRAGFQIAKNATAEEALAAVRAKIAGQARAGSTEQERFGAVLHDSEVIIGAGLLPTLNKYLSSGAKWLTQMNESGRLQKDVASASKTLGEAVGAVRAVLSPVVSGLRLLGKISGGTKNEVELLSGAFLLLEGRAKLIKWGLIATGEREVGKIAAIAAGGVDGLTASFAGLFAQGSKLSGFLKVFSAFGAELPALGDALSVLNGKNPFDNGQSKSGLSPAANSLIFGRNGQFSDKLFKLTKSNRDANLAAQFGDFTSAFDVISKTAQGKGLNKRQFEAFTKKLFAEDAAVAREALGRAATSFDFSTIRPKAATQPVRGLDVPSRFQPAATPIATRTRTRQGLSLQGRFNLADLRLQQAFLTKTTADDKKQLQIEAAITRQQIAQSKTLKDKRDLTAQLVGITAQINGLNDAGLKTATKTVAATKKTRQEKLLSVKDALQARQFKALGLDTTGSPLTPATKSLKRELGTIDKAITGTFLDTSKTQSVLSKIRRVLSGGLGAVTKDVRSQIKSMLDDLDQQIKDNAQKNPLGSFKQLDVSKITAGLSSLSVADRKRLEGSLSRVGVGGAVPNRGVGAFGRQVPDIVVQHTTMLDGRPIEKSVTRHQQKRARRGASQRRGPNAGLGAY